jgi:hypothetical protein
MLAWCNFAADKFIVAGSYNFAADKFIFDSATDGYAAISHHGPLHHGLIISWL